MLIESAINGMLTALDPHSGYLDAKKYRDMQVQTKGEFGGLGIEVTMEDGLVKVVSPIDDTPAFRAGIQAGDMITHINSEPVLGMSLAEAVERMRGPVDTSIALTLRRPGREDALDVSMARAVITISPVRSRVEADIGYIRVTAFNEQTESSLRDAIESLTTELGTKLQGRGARSAQQSRRPARAGGRGRRRLPRPRRDRVDARPPLRQHPALQRAARRSGRRPPDRRADQRRLGLGVGDRGRRAAGSRSRDRDGHPVVRQGLGADHHAASRATARSGSRPRATTRRPGPRSRPRASCPTSRSSSRTSRSSTRGRPAARPICGAASRTIRAAPRRAAWSATAIAVDGEQPEAEDYQLARALDLLRGVAMFGARNIQ